MLVADIDRNKPTEPDQQVERVLSSIHALSVSRIERHTEYRKQQQGRKGIILRNGNKRRGEVLHDPLSASMSAGNRERRHGDPRAQSSWSPQTHDIFVIAVRKDPTFSNQWNIGDEVFVEPPPVAVARGISESSPVPTKLARAIKPSPTSSIEDEKDYIVHLSTPGRNW